MSGAARRYERTITDTKTGQTGSPFGAAATRGPCSLSRSGGRMRPFPLLSIRGWSAHGWRSCDIQRRSRVSPSSLHAVETPGPSVERKHDRWVKTERCGETTQGDIWSPRLRPGSQEARRLLEPGQVKRSLNRSMVAFLAFAASMGDPFGLAADQHPTLEDRWAGDQGDLGRWLVGSTRGWDGGRLFLDGALWSRFLR
jgi:hypothetical protein